MATDQPRDPTARTTPGAAPAMSRPPHTQPALILIVLIGGALGTAARYAVAEAVPTAKDGWPLATLAVNLAGALALGVLLEGLDRRGPDIGRRRQLRLFLGTGFCGGFTTYSALAVELDLLLRDQQLAVAAGYAVVTLLGGVLATVMGIAAAAGHHQWQRARWPINPEAEPR